MHTNRPGWTVVSSKAAANISFQALIPAVVFTTLALVTVLLRWYSRALISRSVGIADVMATVALVLSMGMTGVVGGELNVDAVDTTNDLPSPLRETMMKLVFAQSIFYHLSVNIVKASLVIQYIKIFSVDRGIQVAGYIFLFLVQAAALWGVLGVVFLCEPVHKYWHPGTPGRCIDPQMHFLSCGIMGVVLDFLIWLLPMRAAWCMRIPRKQKLGLLIVFGLGFFVCIVSVLRLTLVHDAAESGNLTKSGTYAVVWSTIEVNVAIICASVLVMKPLYMRLFPKLMLEPPCAREDSRDLRLIITAATLHGWWYADEDGEDSAMSMDLETGRTTRLSSAALFELDEGTSRGGEEELGESGGENRDEAASEKVLSLNGRGGRGARVDSAGETGRGLAMRPEFAQSSEAVVTRCISAPRRVVGNGRELLVLGRLHQGFQSAPDLGLR